MLTLHDIDHLWIHYDDGYEVKTMPASELYSIFKEIWENENNGK